MENLTIGPIEVVFLIVGVTQFIKETLTLSGRNAKILTFAVAFLLTALGYTYSQDLLTGTLRTIVEVLAVALGGAVSAMGYYDLIFKDR